MTVEGTIKMIGETQQVSDSFSKREFVVTTFDQYPQDILIQVVQDKCSLLDTCSVGQAIVVDVNLRGREWTSPKGEVKYFNTIEGWRISTGKERLTPMDKELTKEENDLPF